MTHKERVRKTLNHKQPDRVPIDFATTAVTGIHCLLVEKLRRHYGLADEPVKVVDPYQMLGEVAPDLADALRLDFVGSPPRNTIFGFPNERWKTWRAPWGQELLVSEDFHVVTAEGGGLQIYPAGDTSADPSGHMAAGAYFFDTIIRQEKLDEDKLDPADNLQEFGPFSKEELAHFESERLRLENEDRAVVGNMGGTALGDIALVPGPFLKKPRGIRDISEWYMSTMIRTDYVKAVFDRQVEIAIGNLETYSKIMGDLIDVIFICGTDFGTQDSQFCSPETFEDLWLPYYKRMNDWIHANTNWKTFKHCCGAIIPLIRPMIEAGFDIINPVQVSAAGMDPRKLKNEFGRDVVFWGGGVDTQKTLAFGKPEDVREEVLRHCDIFSTDGGFVFNAVHNMQANVPIENAVAMFDAVNEFNGV